MLTPLPTSDVTVGDQYRKALLEGSARACVWGLGYIGWSTVAALVESEVCTVGYDTSAQRLALLSDADPTTHAGVGLLSDPEAAIDTANLVHFIAVPTERNAQPYLDALIDVLSRLVSATAEQVRELPPLIIIESTLIPGTVEKYVLPMLEAANLKVDVDFLLALAPRRDWFLSEGFGLRDLDRVYSGVGQVSAAAARGVLSLMCDTLHQAPTHVEGELVKCVENAYRHLEITLANQLTLGYPDVDMVEVLRLAATKWNVGLFHPSFGTGGYCIPLSSRYLLRGATKAEELSLLSQAVETDMRMRSLVAEAVSDRGPVLILGLAYKGGIKVSTLSPTIDISRRMTELGVVHTVFDPMFSAQEIDLLLGPGTAVVDLPAAIRSVDVILVVPDHAEFRLPAYLDILNEPRDTPLLLLDNHGALADVEWADHVIYRRAGHPAWLSAFDEEVQTQ